MKILVINGPNLNLLGRREPHIYGSMTLQDIARQLGESYPEVEFLWAQSNHEGDLIDYLHQAADPDQTIHGIILNAGGYSHTSVALRDAVAAIRVPVIEVHLSNTAAREDFRHHSLLTAVCRGSIIGLGPIVYDLATRALLHL